MSIKLLQLNMYAGEQMDTLLPYLEKEQFDILSFQEVTGGEASFDNTNTFQRICDLGYTGEMSITWRLKGKPHSFFGQAIFFKPEFTLLSKEEIWLKPYTEIETLEGFKSEEFPKSVLRVTLEKDNKKFTVFSAHLAWSPEAKDTPEKLRQAKIFHEYLNTVHSPFILSGDFNVTPDTKVVGMVDEFARNLTKEFGLKNTMNLRLHRDREKLQKIGGVAVDYIYVTKEFEVKKFTLLEELDLSDHLGLLLEASL